MRKISILFLDRIKVARFASALSGSLRTGKAIPWFARILLVFGVFMSLASAQTTIHVPADVSTIQGAIQSASNGDSILVASGTYR